MKRSSHVACPRLRESMPPYTPLCVGASDARRLVDVKTTTTTTTNRRVTGPFHKLWTTNKSIAERKQYLSSFSFNSHRIGITSLRNAHDLFVRERERWVRVFDVIFQIENLTKQIVFSPEEYDDHAPAYQILHTAFCFSVFIFLCHFWT